MPLANALAELFSTQADIRRVLADAGIDPERVPLGSSALNDWAAAVEEAERQGKWIDLLKVALHEYGASTGLWNALRERIEERRIEKNESDSMPPNPPPEGNGYYVTFREYSKEVHRIDHDIDELERRVMEKVADTRHKLREEYGPALLDVEILKRLADRRLIVQSVITGLVIVGTVALILFATGGRIVIAGL